MSTDYKIAVLTTVTCEDTALQLAQELIGSHLAACVNILPKVHSIYRWQGEIVDDRESMLLIKTRADKFEEVKEVIKAISGYEVPEVLSFRIDTGSKEFLKWIDGNLQDPNIAEED